MEKEGKKGFKWFGVKKLKLFQKTDKHTDAVSSEPGPSAAEGPEKDTSSHATGDGGATGEQKPSTSANVVTNENVNNIEQDGGAMAMMPKEEKLSPPNNGGGESSKTNNNGFGGGDDRRATPEEAFKVFDEILGEFFFRKFRSYPGVAAGFPPFCNERWVNLPKILKEYYYVVAKARNDEKEGRVAVEQQRPDGLTALKLAHSVARILTETVDDGDELAKKVCSLPTPFFFFREDQTALLKQSHPSLSSDVVKNHIYMLWTKASKDVKRRYKHVAAQHENEENARRQEYERKLGPDVLNGNLILPAVIRTDGKGNGNQPLAPMEDEEEMAYGQLILGQIVPPKSAPAKPAPPFKDYY